MDLEQVLGSGHVGAEDEVKGVVNKAEGPVGCRWVAEGPGGSLVEFDRLRVS